MVKSRKGISYVLEVIIAILVVISFSFGIVEYTGQEQDWSEYRGEIAANDLTYSLYESGHMEVFVQHSNTGSLKTAVNAISGRDTEISGSIQNIPLNEINMGFHTLQEDVHDDLDVTEVSSGDRCYNDLEEIEEEKVDGDILRTNDDFEDNYNVRLYFADTGAVFSEDVSYDSLWVDNSTSCQFSNEDGPFYLDEIFLWGDRETVDPNNHFAFKGIENQDTLTVHNASQVHNFREMFRESLNGIPTDTSVNTFTFDESLSDFNVVVFRQADSLEEIQGNEAQLSNYLEDNYALFLLESDIGQNNFQNSFLDAAGFEWLAFPNTGEIGYNDPDYEGGQSGVQFTESGRSDQVLTYFRGLRGEPFNLEMSPPGKIKSNTDEGITTEKPILEGLKRYDSSELEVEETLDSDHTYTGDPEYCERYEDTLEFPTGEYGVINSILEAEGCGAVASNIDSENNDEYEMGPYLIGEEFVLDNINYMAFPTCQDESEDCAEFIFTGNENIELIPHRSELDNVDGGEEIAIASYEEEYEEQQLKVLGALIYYMSEDEIHFEGQESSTDISTSVIGSVDNEAHIPYKMDLRWSR